jgi:GTP-binding protein
MIRTEASFIKSSKTAEGCPPPVKPEYAFIGRSNVGKSSLINMLTGQKGLAKTSSTPGKTQLINHFLVNDAWYLVDLPGYGFAKVSKSDKKDWDVMIRNYLLRRENLMNVFLLIDSRHEPQKNDLTFIEWLGSNGIPFSLVFTKTDKQSATQTAANIAVFGDTLKQTWDELPPFFRTSSEKRSGREELIGYIEETVGLFSKS